MIDENALYCSQCAEPRPVEWDLHLEDECECGGDYIPFYALHPDTQDKVRSAA